MTVLIPLMDPSSGKGSEFFVFQGKANQSGPQTARTATKAVSNWYPGGVQELV